MTDFLSKQVSIAEARKSLAALVHTAEGGSPVGLTRRGKPVAVLLSREDYERLRGAKGDPWAAILAFRQEANLEELDAESALTGLRVR